MTFIRGVLQRARGEVGAIRPRRDIAQWLAPESSMDIDPLARFAETDPAASTPMPMRPRATLSAEPEAPRSDLERTQANDAASLRRAQAAPQEPAASSVPDQTSPASVRVHMRASDRHAFQRGPASADAARASIASLPRNDSELADARASQASSKSASNACVDIHIGKIEISPPAPSRAAYARGASRTTRSPLTLSEYLSARSKER